MNHQIVINQLNSHRPPFLDLLNCEITEVDPNNGICIMDFDISKQFCHSIDIIQGGFVTAMLDAVSSHAVFVMSKDIVAVSTLELKVSFYKPSRAGQVRAKGQVIKKGRSIAFVSAELYNSEGEKTASLTATAKIGLAKPA